MSAHHDRQMKGHDRHETAANDDADHPLAGYRPPNLLMDMTWLNKFLRDKAQRNGAALAEMHQAQDRQGSVRMADPQLEDREAEP